MITAGTVFVWDVDGTLYRPTRQLHDEIRKNEITVIANHKKWPYEKAEAEFYKLYKRFSPSGTAVASRIAGISVEQAASEMGKLIAETKKNYLACDQKLIEMFAKLTEYTHYILSNGSVANIKGTLELIGLSPEVFSEIITSETVGENKPSLAGFEYIIKKTGKRPDQHLMVGDREEVDILPALRAGMRTVLVWADRQAPTQSTYVAPTVYDIPEIIF